MAPCDITSHDELHRLPNFLSLVFCRFLRRETDNVLYVYAYSALSYGLVTVFTSQAGIVWKWLEESSWYLAWRLPSTYPNVCIRKIRVLPSGTLSRTPDLENLATASRLRCQQHSSSSSSTVELVDDIYTTVDESRLFTTSRSTVTLCLHNFDLLWICRTSCFYSWQDFDWERVARSVCGSGVSCWKITSLLHTLHNFTWTCRPLLSEIYYFSRLSSGKLFRFGTSLCII